ncbi:hypothetical protein H5T51_09565, partial [Candidatus Bathyarchaeota archaeon]|nr:hypothetical protein [Candidatus Bathyarchaeota archaeon]
MKMKARRKLADEASVALLIFIFAILYRALLIAADPYPPGPDLGLHNSIINSILMNNGKFTQNLYHMGGGDSLTHPGFHFFASTILLFTEAPAYVVQSAVAVLFSSLTVLCAYLLTKAIWPLPAAPLIAAFLTAISKHDLDMLLWGGYPNVIALTLIPLIFYIFFRKNTSRSVLLTIASILIGTLTFTHSLSALMFMAILASFLLICLIASRRTNNKMEGGSPLLLIFAAILLGFIVGLPFLAEVLPVYLTNVEQGLFVGSIDVHRTAIVLTRMIPLEVASLALIPALLIFFFSKKYRGRFFDRAGVLFSLWMIVPALSTQSFIIGLYTDYYRLLYFLVFPVIVFLALLFDHGFRFFAYNIAKFLELHNL